MTVTEGAGKICPSCVCDALGLGRGGHVFTHNLEQGKIQVQIGPEMTLGASVSTFPHWP